MPGSSTGATARTATPPMRGPWQWDITSEPDGVQVTVSWDGYPKTIGRKLIAAPIRRRMLEREVAASLDALRRTLERAGTDET